ncbi:MAG: ROK family protein [Turicibacter sp.]|nr:ROK family protein [Turicibacter sp.]
MYYGSIEAGGTKFVCAIGDADFNVVERVSFPTTTPEETFAHVFAFFDQYALKAIGIGSFGPIDINPASSTYGYITTTPKPQWGNVDFLGAVKARYEVPIGFTTDVNAAALGEQRLGAAKGLSSCLYLTVGTGIGGGAVVNGQLLSGYSHPEMGHIIIHPHPEDGFAGICPYHGNCFEGLASGPAIEARYGVKADQLSESHTAWDFVALYIAQAVMNYVLILSPEKVILGGGVMKQEHLFYMIQTELAELMADYVALPDLETYIVPPKLGDDAATIGCFMLAESMI